MSDLYPPIEPYEHGMLDVGDGDLVYWEACGDPGGKPALVLHGGPGSGSGPFWRRLFDPEAYRIVAFDQRGCGRSTPDAADPQTSLAANTTDHLIADIERLRAHLGIDRWLVIGGSWGVTLALAYAERHPASVSELVLFSVTNTTRREVEWVTRDMGRVFPEEWARFRDAVPETDRDGDLAAAYARMLADPDPAVREKAALEWCRWEDVHVSTAPGHRPDPRYEDPRFRMRFARLVTHYWANAAFVEDGALLRDAAKLNGIPGVLIHGRMDISSPADVAWNLAQVWQDAELVLISDEGHGASGDATVEAIRRATDRFRP
ncbi:prolyl aminopeptidase [Glycomyces dulcitolivorans]|uniref:prolyl aminopeptidase n=1 Tax=Glycomyces dulcitolivorans TaxID=2200759 RepID=UPI000DD30BE4|nr:prolyl aminopeptidase [Glycomyces dulcitolivorans]